MLAPAGSLLYSLLHLGGFAGDLNFYRTRCGGASRVLEYGCGDGRVAAALVLGEASLTVLQQQQQQQQHEDAAPVFEKLKCDVGAVQYVGVELSEPLAAKARARLAVAESCTQIVSADMHEPLDEGDFDAVVLSANTFFCTPRHALVLERCAEALTPGGTLLLDVYNAVEWHEDAEAALADDAADEEHKLEEVVVAAAATSGVDDDLLVVVEDEEGLEWKVYEREPSVDAAAQTIVCHYDFESAVDGTLFSQTVEHHYVLPEELVRMLDAAGFAIEAIDGGFDGQSFEAAESDHLVVVARLRGGPESA